ncbi:FG-GAP-like repeat-containing protein [Wenjunlia tyrosinilytica]|uniref:FG-GAP repeat protein n=1 Tax=Wenjunlia tyrosinilytica TaxID=1544741 RepID=A0A917ZL35_9ACTN|nr:FG-GAP-like repeat-containing protein [Wenjunlia tyrosinilytica]GGO84928.1 hypothetical protein GCM10012280_17530 [Wenjunlia tyrosinilytica]
MRTRRSHLLTIGAVAAAALTALVTVPWTHADAVSAPVSDDFNGDGLQDLVVATPDATVGGHTGAGAVVVAYGTVKGAEPGRRTVLTQDTPGVPDSAETGDHFGESVTSADLDNDGYADLVIGSYGENLSTGSDQGSVTVVRGGSEGLSGGSSLVEPGAVSGAMFGRGLATGDFDNDSRADIAVLTNSRLWVYSKGFTRNGPVGKPVSVPGPGPHGLPPFEAATINDAASGDLDDNGHDDLVVFGMSRTTRLPFTGVLLGGAHGLTWSKDLKSGDTGDIGDVDHDGYDDLVTGLASPQAGTDPSAGSGYVRLWYGSRRGPGGERESVTFTQSTAGVPGTNEKGDRFGRSVSVGDATGWDAYGDSYADVVVGAPGEDVGKLTDAGSVVLLKGGPTGLTGSGAQVIDQDTAGVPGTAENGDRFGWAVRLYDTTREGQAELAATAPYENALDGAFWVLHGSATGLTTTGARAFDPDTFGLESKGKRFGSALNH